MGNLLNRTLSMLVKYFDGEVKPEFKDENPLTKKALGTVQIVKNHFDNYESQKQHRKLFLLSTP